MAGKSTMRTVDRGWDKLSAGLRVARSMEVAVGVFPSSSKRRQRVPKYGAIQDHKTGWLRDSIDRYGRQYADELAEAVYSAAHRGDHVYRSAREASKPMIDRIRGSIDQRLVKRSGALRASVAVKPRRQRSK